MNGDGDLMADENKSDKNMKLQAQMISDQMKLVKKLGSVKHKLVVMSGKGGVGKTTVSVNLAFALAHATKKSVGILDADIHGPNVPKMLGMESVRPDVKDNQIIPIYMPLGDDYGIKVMSMAFLIEPDTPVIWRGPLVSGAIEQFVKDVDWGELEYMIIDMPPGTGDEALTIAQKIPNVDGSVIVTTPQEVALLDSRKAVNFSKQLNLPVVGIIENMSGLICPYCGKKIYIFKQGGGEKASRDLDVPFLGKVPLEPKLVEDGDAGVPFLKHMEDSEAAKAFMSIVDKVREKVE